MLHGKRRSGNDQLNTIYPSKADVLTTTGAGLSPARKVFTTWLTVKYDFGFRQQIRILASSDSTGIAKILVSVNFELSVVLWTIWMSELEHVNSASLSLSVFGVLTDDSIRGRSLGKCRTPADRQREALDVNAARYGFIL